MKKFLVRYFLYIFMISGIMSCQKKEPSNDALSSSAVDIANYTVVVEGEPVGRQIAEITAEGEWCFSFELNRNGRDTRLTSLVRLDETGIPVYIETRGRDNRGVEVEKFFSLADGDPASKISDIRKVELTIKDGVVYRVSDLYRAIGMQ